MTTSTLIVPFVFVPDLFALAIYQARIDAGLAQEAVAQLVGCSDTNISTLEAGKEPNPKVGNILALCKLYDLDPRAFFMLDA